MVRMFLTASVAFLFILAATVHIIWLISMGIGRCFSYHLPYRPFGITSLCLVAFFTLILAYGFLFGRWNVKTAEQTYINKDIPAAFDGYRLVHISDLHLSTFEDKPDALDKFVEKINALDPDLVCFTGDMVSLSAAELSFGTALKKLKSKDGVVAVLGNHDFFIYSGMDNETRRAAVDSVVAFQRDTLGWCTLRNQNVKIERGGEHITVIGVDNINGYGQGFKTVSLGDLKKAMEGADGFRILLSHDPSHWTSETVPDTDIPLTLSGHTHAAQLRFFGWTPASWMFDQVYGRYDIGNQTLHINIGLGCTAPVRIGAYPEIDLIILKNKPE